MANEIERRYGSRGLHALSLMPGGIATGLQVHMGEGMQKMMKIPEVHAYMKNAEQGAATTIWAAIGKEMQGKGGLYLEGQSVNHLPELFVVGKAWRKETLLRCFPLAGIFLDVKGLRWKVSARRKACEPYGSKNRKPASRRMDRKVMRSTAFYPSKYITEPKR